MRRVLIVAARDFRATVMTRAFFFAVVGMPLLLLAVLGVTTWLVGNHEEAPLRGTLALIDPTGEVAPAARVAFDPARLAAARERVLARSRAVGGEALETAAKLLPEAGAGSVDVTIEAVAVERAVDGTDPPEGVPPAVRERVRSGELLGAAYVSEATLRDASRYQLVVRGEMDSDRITLIERGLAEAAVRARLGRRGLDLDTLTAVLERPQAETNRVLADGTITGASSGRRMIKKSLIPAIFMMLLWAGAFAAGQQLLFGTIEEKSNKLMEVLLSAISPMQLMAGKIIGQGLVGLVILGVYSSVGVASLIALASLDLVAPSQLVLLGAYFLMAYFMIAPVMAAIGSAVSTVHEANALLMPVMVLLLVPLGLWFPISQDPNGWVATVFSFVPPVMPFVLVLRIAADAGAGGVPAWQIAVTLVWGLAAIVGMVWVASRVFRVGLLMEGKPPSLSEIVRWALRG